MELIPKKGLIVDYSTEDARALHKRQVKQEKFLKRQSERKKEEKQLEKT